VGYRDASKNDKKLGAKLAITYAKSSPNKRYRVNVGDEVMEVSPFATKGEAQRYFFNAPKSPTSV
jgi:hypothetical protein